MSFTAEQLSRHPGFLLSIRHLAGTMRGMFEAGPRLARDAHLTSALATHPDSLCARHAARSARSVVGFFSRRADDAHYRDTRWRAATRVLNFIEELYTYRFIAHTPGDERRRPRHFEPAEVSHQAMFGWLLANLAALDILDGGDRAAYFQAHPELIRLAQPLHCPQMP